MHFSFGISPEHGTRIDWALVAIKVFSFYKCTMHISNLYFRIGRNQLTIFCSNCCHYLAEILTMTTHITHVSCVPKKNTWYLFEGDFTAPSGNSSICELRPQCLKKNAEESQS